MRPRQLTMLGMLTGGPFLREVAEEYMVEPSELVSKSRKQEVVEARVEVAKRLWGAGLDMTQIGKVLLRHRSTISYHLAKSWNHQWARRKG